MENRIPDVFKEFQDAGDKINMHETEYFDMDRNNEIKISGAEIRNDMSGFEGKDVVVFGDPISTGESLDHLQGDNPYFAKGNCGLVSTANFLNLCGISAADENMITKYAIDNDECNHGWFVPSAERGGVERENMQRIIRDFGIDTQLFEPFEQGGRIEDIANRLEAGYVGIMGVNAGYLWDDPAYVGDGFSNHEGTLTGTVRDSETGELLGLTICDSGYGKACDVLSLERLQSCYESVPGANVIFSTSSIRSDLRA